MRGNSYLLMQGSDKETDLQHGSSFLLKVSTVLLPISLQ